MDSTNNGATAGLRADLLLCYTVLSLFSLFWVVLARFFRDDFKKLNPRLMVIISIKHSNNGNSRSSSNNEAPVSWTLGVLRKRESSANCFDENESIHLAAECWYFKQRKLAVKFSASNFESTFLSIDSVRCASNRYAGRGIAEHTNENYDTIFWRSNE